jgi:hypothetical protein
MLNLTNKSEMNCMDRVFIFHINRALVVQPDKDNMVMFVNHVSYLEKGAVSSGTNQTSTSSFASSLCQS